MVNITKENFYLCEDSEFLQYSTDKQYNWYDRDNILWGDNTGGE